ncbi:MAG TPA: hypothetical protein VN428_02990 [Bryobacteraceae bacterium]|nr:hypothetical protein [Bryobacteraceae bacterium]
MHGASGECWIKYTDRETGRAVWRSDRNAAMENVLHRIALVSLFAAPLMLPGVTPSVLAQPVRAAALKCEYRANPLGIDIPQPRLSWVLEASSPKARGVRQSAYRILVASNEQMLMAGKGDYWDSGKIASGQSIHVVYGGRPLASGARAWWKVQVWDQSGKPSGWSQPALWSAGLKPEDWKAKWIGRDEAEPYRNPTSPFQNLRQAQWIWSPADASGAHHFRAEVTVPNGRAVKGATFVIAADQSYELALNGKPVGKGSTVRWPETYDVTGMLHAGVNRIAVSAASQSKNAAGLIAALRVDFESGDPLIFTTGPAWQAAESNIENAAWTAAKVLGPYGIGPWGEVGFSEERALPARMLRKEFEAPARCGVRLRTSPAWVCLRCT